MRSAALLVLVFAAAPLGAKDSLGVFGHWGAFRDPGAGRCYAIAVPELSRATREYQPFAAVGTWPARGVRGQVHFRLSRKLAPRPALTLSIGGQRFALSGGGGDAWAADRTMDASIVAAMRSAGTMWVGGRDNSGRRFSDAYRLDGAATAMDAASVGCAGMRR